MELKHAEMVKKLVKPGVKILAEMTPSKMTLLHMSSKLCSEAGELMDAVGKLCYYNRVIDLDNVIEELGDIEFYLSGFRQSLGILRDTTLRSNMEKLTKRYKDFKYTDEQAHQRNDKVMEQPKP